MLETLEAIQAVMSLNTSQANETEKDKGIY